MPRKLKPYGFRGYKEWLDPEGRKEAEQIVTAVLNEEQVESVDLDFNFWHFWRSGQNYFGRRVRWEDPTRILSAKSLDYFIKLIHKSYEEDHSNGS